MTFLTNFGYQSMFNNLIFNTMKNNKSIYQDCPNCWGYQEYEKNESNKINHNETISTSRTLKLFKISGTNVEEADMLYK